MKFILIIVLLFFISSCCNYPPLIDRPLLLDFIPKHLIPSDSVFTVKNDSLKVKIKISAIVPTKCRSLKLKFFMAEVNIEIEKNLFKDTLSLNISQLQVIASDGIYYLRGTLRDSIISSTSELKIIKENILPMFNNGKSRLIYKFEYSEIFNFEKIYIKIFPLFLRSSKNVTINTREIVASLK